jgi:hypothetical protein
MAIHKDEFFVHFLTQLHLPPLRFHCVAGCWDRTQDCCYIWQPDVLTTRLDLIHISARYHTQAMAILRAVKSGR